MVETSRKMSVQLHIELHSPSFAVLYKRCTPRCACIDYDFWKPYQMFMKKDERAGLRAAEHAAGWIVAHVPSLQGMGVQTPPCLARNY